MLLFSEHYMILEIFPPEDRFLPQSLLSITYEVVVILSEFRYQHSDQELRAFSSNTPYCSLVDDSSSEAH
jgi:hypothetical protein